MSNTDFDQLVDVKARKLLRFDGTINSGHILQILVMVVGIFLAYSAIREQQATQRVELEQVKTTAIADKQQVKESIADLKADMKELQRSVNEANQRLAAIAPPVRPRP